VAGAAGAGAGRRPVLAAVPDTPDSASSPPHRPRATTPRHASRPRAADRPVAGRSGGDRSAALPPARAADVPRLSTSARDLLGLARAGLAEAASATAASDRYAAAHLSALRAAAAVIAAHARPADPAARRPRPLSAWVLLTTVAPELGEWAAFFAAGARKRAAAEAHLPGAVTAREADDLLRDAETFLAVVETKLGSQPSLLARGAG
jgi:hypothetical protein